ncbi:hypothetical protein M8C21_017766 [Ambrosia artemisiifolia]|uniref:Uncharacterized protein n=1 Tax=Ambrosia artemisiifolia TaxID=4212 RepID=A0AAD5GGX5_AMBAR|nr:hypothetical protein M8C21_017766 [Ambrosia artemisiifolia]
MDHATKSHDKKPTQPIPVPLSPLTEWPEFVNTSRYCPQQQQPDQARRRGIRRGRKLLRLGKTSRCHDSDDGGDDGSCVSERWRNINDKRVLLLGVLGCPLAPISVEHGCGGSADLQYNIKDIPFERSTAQYIIHQYLAATGCLKMMSTNSPQQQQSGYYKNMYTSGTVKMTCCETEISSIQGQRVTNTSGRSHETDNVNGCFVLWQMVPGMWSLELVLSSGNKVLAGSDGETVWSHTPSLGKQIAKGPKRPLRRIIQGLDPKSTAMLFAKAERLGDKKIGGEECFVLKVCASTEDLIARDHGPGPILVEVLRHVLYGYFSQKSGLLVYMEDSQLTRAIVGHDHSDDSNIFCDDQKIEEVMYWETSIGSSIGDYKAVEGLMVAHQGRSVATVFGFPDLCLQDQQPYMYRTRFEEVWNIDDIAFNIHGLSSHSFLPPSQ